MNLLKSLSLAALLTLGLGAFAAENENQLSDEAVLLLNGDETPMDEVEAAALSDTGDYDPAIRRVRITCQSFFFFTHRCAVPGRVVSVRLVRQLGFTPCVAGRTFGASSRSIWVRSGCSGTFAVRYRR